jgi:ubiquitin-protein ligase E3 C
MKISLEGGGAVGSSRLPMAASCFNQFKLPQYETIEELREKLLYSIQSKSGFELS